jgi:hypothetical protein
MSARMPVSGPYTALRPEALRSLRRPVPGPQAKAVPYLSKLSFVDRKQVALHDPVDCAGSRLSPLLFENDRVPRTGWLAATTGFGRRRLKHAARAGSP